MADLVTLGVFLAGSALGAVGGWLARRQSGDVVPRHEAEAARALLDERAAKYKQDIQDRLDEIRDLRAQNHDFHEKSVTLRAERDALDRQAAAQDAQLAAMQQKMQLEFENLSNRIFETKSTAFREQSKESIGLLLNPLNDKLADFRKLVGDSFTDQLKEQASLKEQIRLISDAHEKMTMQTESLTKALRGDSKVQGDWGEIILEQILEDCGLRQGENYILQGADLGMKHAETGQQQKPDVVVKLPDGKHIVIDSKVSLTSYERYCAEADQTAQAAHLRDYLTSVKNHIVELARRRYQDSDRLDTPDFVMMFMPIESAYALALQADRELHAFAWNRQVALVCPSTLFTAMRTVQSLWRIEKQNRNAALIGEKSGQLYDKIFAFMKDMEDIGKALGKAGDSYDKALKKLSTGNGNVLRKTEELKKLGAKTAKQINTLDDSEGEGEDLTEVENILKIAVSE